MKFRKKPFGFTALEILIAIAVIAILLAVAVPNYYDYKRHIEFSYVADTANHYKTQVEKCAIQHKSLNLCSSSNGKIQVNAGDLENGYVQSLAVTQGVIRATATDHSSLKGETYVLTPNYQNQRVTWSESGSGCQEGLCE